MELWNDQLLVKEGNWQDVSEAAKSVRNLLVQRLVNRSAIPLSNGIAYWKSVPQTWGTAALFYVQNTPLYFVRQLINPSSSMITTFHKTLGREWDRLGSRESGVLAYIVGRSRAVQMTFKHVAVKVASKNTEELEKERKQVAEQIGRLLVCEKLNDLGSSYMTVANLDESTQNSDGLPTKLFVSRLASAMGINYSPRILSSQTPQQALATLQKVLDQQPARTNGRIPSWLTRWWPVLALALWGSLKLNGSWTATALWLQNSVWDTCCSFWNNWVVDPLVKIYMTIRHDPTHQVALIAKESLASDVKSLERMVVDFARDMNSGLTSDKLKAIGIAASNGNVTTVMNEYEKQLSNPIKNLISGKLMRTLLIQVQKTKVDLEVALSGIDQLLSSQQLVFVLIAAIPALSVVWWLTKHTLRNIYLKFFEDRASDNETTAIFTSLQELDSVVQNAGTRLTDEDLGLIFCEITIITNNLSNNNSAVSQQLKQCIDRLMNHAIERDGNAVLADLDRTYTRYMMAKLKD